ncbi:ABC transporter family protein [Synechococcus sp. PROS-7-1]|uniref:ATP-binding cassette domain-containing protein n=1 Tax=Synechococcus sp. PROS-7-1 TaxID=1442556 RepID=UPI00185F7E77|nr:ATP-binding cassette domain-containing protein [Synechococcus sp. PROS-7-1]QNI86496.1 ABC transporter family protein [Synechococcus sp. PROS-7-1]
MNLNPGERIAWPVANFSTTQDHLLGAMQGVPFIRIKPNLVIPGLPLKSLQNLKLELIATQENNLIQPINSTALEGTEWLNSEILRRLNRTKNIPTSSSIDDLCELLEELMKLEQSKKQQKIGSHQSLGNQAEYYLFSTLERSEQFDAKAQKQTNFSKLACMLAKIKGIDVEDITEVKSQHKNTRGHLQQLLEHNNLIGRDVLINSENLKSDCGDLIAFEEEKNDAPILLKTTGQGYQIFDPMQMESGKYINNCPGVLKKLSPRMVAINRSLSNRDLSTIGLLRFAFGESKNFGQFVIAGLLIGLAAGFLLSIGRDIGASRWIFTLAASGGLLGAALGYVSQGFRSGIALMAIATGLAMLTPTFNTIITNNALPDQDLGLLLQISLVMVAAGVTRVALEWLQSRDVLLTQHQGAAKVQLAGMYRLLSLPTEFFRLRSIGDLQLRFGAFEDIRLEIQTMTEGGLVRLLLISTYVLFMLKISVKLTLLAITLSAFIALPTILLAIQSRKLKRHQEIAESEAQSRNLELINSVSKLRVAGAETKAARWWAEPYKQVVSLENAIDAKEAAAELIKSVMPNLGTLLIYIMITRLIAEAAISKTINAPNIGEQLGFFAAFNTYIGGIAGLAGLFAGAFDLPVLYERARPILDEQPEAQDNSKEIGLLHGDFQLDRVSYRYQPELPLVLDGVSFAAKAGEYVAIVGPSGSGKSTLVRLLLGFAEPENGSILFDGRPLAGLDPKSVRRQIGTVLQSNSLFSASMMEAIAGGAVIQEDEAWHAAELAGLADDIRAMPMGMHTVIPDGGGTLSGGQKQRVAIARALVRKPRLLIFDEATSALDNHSQAVVTRSLDKLSVTRIVIAHRLSTIRHADQIIVMESGQVKEQGTYDTLMVKKGLFKRLMERQIK